MILLMVLLHLIMIMIEEPAEVYGKHTREKLEDLHQGL